MGFFKNLFDGLKKTREALSYKLEVLFQGSELDDEFYEELEYILISSDISSSVCEVVIEELKERVIAQKIKTTKEAKAILKQVLVSILLQVEPVSFTYPTALMIVGVNGVGKTTTLGKLANYFKQNKKEPVLVAADTFRAAASDQLSEWAKRVKVRIIKHTEGADPSAVVYDAVASAKAKHTDVLLIDTAGRLHNKVGLMEELKKINRTVEKNYQDCSFKKFLVLDATTGQNALSQVKYFNEAVELDGIVLTKLDGTAKGGIVLSIVNDYKIPVSFIGVGETLDDLRPFDAKDFIDAIL
jgi:fused signal recognition particle receptor